jgi:hypothetical protein
MLINSEVLLVPNIVDAFDIFGKLLSLTSKVYASPLELQPNKVILKLWHYAAFQWLINYFQRRGAWLL